MFRTTLDIDTNDKEFIRRILMKINQCQYLNEMDLKESELKGYHIILSCYIKCDVCRMCYDDQKRFNFDQDRPYYLQNVLFDKTEIV